MPYTIKSIKPIRDRIIVSDMDGRWSRGVELENDDGSTITLRQADKDAILLISDEKPSDAYIAAEKLLNLSTD